VSHRAGTQEEKRRKTGKPRQTNAERAAQQGTLGTGGAADAAR
jgi:hypothetical protein